MKYNNINALLRLYHPVVCSRHRATHSFVLTSQIAKKERKKIIVKRTVVAKHTKKSKVKKKNGIKSFFMQLIPK